MIRRLTEKFVRECPFEVTQQKYTDDQVPGFGLLVGRHTKSFYLQKNNKRLTLGNYPECSAKLARDLALQKSRAIASLPIRKSRKSLIPPAKAWTEV